MDYARELVERRQAHRHGQPATSFAEAFPELLPTIAERDMRQAKIELDRFCAPGAVAPDESAYRACEVLITNDWRVLRDLTQRTVFDDFALRQIMLNVICGRHWQPCLISQTLCPHV